MNAAVAGSPHPPRPVGIPTRREVLRLAAGAAAALGSGLLAGCGGRPTAAATVITLRFGTYNWGGTGQRLLAEGAQLFEASHPGLRLQTSAVDSEDLTALQATAVWDGTAPDVFWGQDFGSLATAGALLPLDDYLTRDHVPGTLWPTPRVDGLRRNGVQLALPAYTGVTAYAVRLAFWDALKRPRPSPSWTSAELSTEAAALTRGSGSVRRYGTNLQWYSNWLGDNAWAFRAFGGRQMAPGGGSSSLSIAGSVAAGQWLYGLIWAGQASSRDQQWHSSVLTNDQAAMLVVGPWSVASHAVNFGDRFAWDYYPFPAFPAGPTTYANGDFFAISSRTTHPEPAWELLHWLTAEQPWQRWVLQAGLLPPGLLSMWDEWESLLTQVAPVLKGKALHVFSDGARGNRAYPQEYYRVADDRAQSVAAGFVSALWNRQMNKVSDAFQAADVAINGTLNTGAASRAQAQSAVRAATAALTAGTALPAPPDPSVGSAMATAPSSLLSVSTGQYTVVGNGAGIEGSADGCVFCGSILQTEKWEASCQVLALEDGSGPSVAPEAQVGLMVRCSMLPDDPMLAIAASGTQGLVLTSRPERGLPSQSWTGASAPAGGLLSPSLLTSASGSGRKLRPTWLKLQRDGRTFRAYSSPDGQHWVQAGPTLQLGLGGLWVGVFGTAANARAGQTVRATVSNVTPAPTRVAQVGLA